MNSEELEQSLRAEFENYLKGVVAEMRQSVSDFQEKINQDFEKQKEQLEATFLELNEQIGKERELELSFTGSVAEHLKLAKDEGARITATAIAEAEELREDPEPLDYSDLRNAINDISEKDSQSEILKALVNHATEFTPRGAFFIVKNEHLVGWRVFGREGHEDPQVVREVFFPVNSNTALSDSVEQLSTVSSLKEDSEDDLMYRNKLGFENPDEMYAIPLIARGRGVAVLYADSGSTGEPVNVSAIETLMRVAGLTVEVLASAPPVTSEDSMSDSTAAPAPAFEEPAEQAEASEQFVSEEEATEETAQFVAPVSENVEEPTPFESVSETEKEESETYQFVPVAEHDSEFEAPDAEPTENEYQPPPEYGGDEVEAAAEEFDETDSATFDADEWAQPVDSPSADFADTLESEIEAPAVEAPEFEAFDSGINEPYAEPEAVASDFEFESDSDESSMDTSKEASFEDAVDSSGDFGFDAAEEVTSFDATEAEESESDMSFKADDDSEEDGVTPFDSFKETDEEDEEDEEAVTEEVEAAPVVEAAPIVEAAPVEEAAAPVRPRFADRNLDLPIEVGEDERRLHNDARRFARLLVSEIKLYNEQKVKEGRESNDLYERLREAIDRSREMYDKRVQPPVAAKFDYFNYELVNTLAEGDEGKLGGSYPGPAV